MSDLETRLRTALHEEVASLRAPSELADHTAQHGARARRRRRLCVAVGGLALVAIAAPLLRGITESTTTVGPVAPHPSVRHSPHPGKTTAPVQSPKAWEAGLPDGRQPAVPYLQGMTYHWSPRPGGTASYSVPDVNTNVFGPVRGGLAVARMDTPAGRPTFGVATTGGAFRRLGAGSAFGMAASPDGRRVAVGDSGRGRVRVYDVASGRMLTSRAINGARVLSWGPGGIYYETGFLSGHPTVWVWDPGSGQAPRQAPAALDRYGVGLAARPGCTRLVTPDSTSDCLPVPSSAVDQAVSEDGSYVAYIASGTDRSASVGVLDVFTGQTRRLTPPLPFTAVGVQSHNLVWEHGDRLLFVLSGNGPRPRAGASMIRCSPAGGCEVAMRDVTGPGNDFFPTLALTPPFIY